MNNGSRVGGVEQTREQFALTPDCAHIAAAAVFGIISWDPCMDKLLSVLEGGDTRRDGVAVLVSRVVALLADALPRRRQKRALYREKKEMDGEENKDEDGEDGEEELYEDGEEEPVEPIKHSPGGVEAVGLIARLTSSDAGRRALLAHAPGVVGYLLPCLRAELGQTAAFQVRALCGIARSRHGMQLLLRYERADRLMGNLSGMLPDAPGVAEFFIDDDDAADDDADDAQLDRVGGAPPQHMRGQVLSEVVIAIATLSQEKAWRWRLLDITSDVPRSVPDFLDDPSASSADVFEETHLKNLKIPGREFSTVRLVASLVALLRSPHQEVVFNTLYCINCLMGEPPQSWGRGRDPNREEDHAARRALVVAAAFGRRIAAVGRGRRSARDGGDDGESEETTATPPHSLTGALAHVLNSKKPPQAPAKVVGVSRVSDLNVEDLLNDESSAADEEPAPDEGDEGDEGDEVPPPTRAPPPTAASTRPSSSPTSPATSRAGG